MTDIRFNRRLFNIVLCGLALMVLLASCSPFDPYAVLASQPETAIPNRTATAQPYPIMTTKSTDSPETCIVTTGIDTGTLNLRLQDGTQYPVIGVLHEGDALTMTGNQAGQWIEVTTTRNVTGWINSNYCTKGQ
jgi:uncharacterized protein YgiM (DUF1202 family)